MSRRVVVATLGLTLALACGPNRTFPGPTPDVPGEEEGFTCLPNLDGVLEAGELPVALGETVGFLVNPEGVSRSVDVEGRVDEAGRRIWDLGTDFADDRIVPIGPASIAQQWFAADFPEADYAAPVDLDGRVLGVYHTDERGLCCTAWRRRSPTRRRGARSCPTTSPCCCSGCRSTAPTAGCPPAR